MCELVVRSFSVLGNPASVAPPDLIECQARRHCRGDAAESAARLEGFLTRHEDRVWVRREGALIVLAAILEVLPRRCDDTDAVWALGLVDPWECSEGVELSLAVWDSETARAVVDRGVAALKGVAGTNHVLARRRDGSLIPREAFGEDRPLRILYRIHQTGVMHDDLRDSVRNLVGWTLNLDPGRAIELLDDDHHPVVAAYVAQEAGALLRDRDRHATLDWIRPTSGEMAIGAAVYETLCTAAELNDDLRGRAGTGPPNASHVTPSEQVNASPIVVELLEALVERLVALREPRGILWLGELLGETEYLLPRASLNSEVVNDVASVSGLAERAAAGVLLQTADVKQCLEALIQGMRAPPRATTARHLEAIAALIEAQSVDLALTIRRRFLEIYADQLQASRHGHFHVGAEGDARSWTESLGGALAYWAVAEGASSVVAFLGEELDGLGLSIWDFEEEYEQFLTDASIAQHLFTVAALGAARAHQRSPQVGGELAIWLVDRFWEVQPVIACTWLPGDHAAWAAPTVMAAMIACHPDGVGLAAALIASPHVPPAALAVLAISDDSVLRDAARDELINRFEDHWSLKPLDARLWARVFERIADPERGLRALRELPLEDHRLASPEDHLLGLEFALQLLLDPTPQGVGPMPFDAGSLRELALACHARCTMTPALGARLRGSEEKMRSLGLLNETPRR